MDKVYIYLIGYKPKNKSTKKYLLFKYSDNTNQEKIYKIIFDLYKSLNREIDRFSFCDNLNDKETFDLYNTEIHYMKILSEATKEFVEFDEYHKKWVLRTSYNINYKKLDYLYDKKLKLYLVGDSQLNLLRDKAKMNYIEYLFKDSFSVSDMNTLIYNNKVNSKCDISNLLDVLSIYKDDKSTKISICFDNTIDILSVIDFSKLITEKFNKFHIFLVDNKLQFKTITFKNNELVILDRMKIYE